MRLADLVDELNTYLEHYGDINVVIEYNDGYENIQISDFRLTPPFSNAFNDNIIISLNDEDSDDFGD